MKFGRYFLIILAILIISAIGGKFTNSSFNINEFVKSANESLKPPALMDEGLRLDSVSAENKVIVFKYTLMDFSENKSPIDTYNSIESSTFSSVCALSDSSIEDFINNGVIVRTDYFNNLNQLVLSVNVEPKQCKRK